MDPYRLQVLRRSLQIQDNHKYSLVKPANRKRNLARLSLFHLRKISIKKFYTSECYITANYITTEASIFLLSRARSLFWAQR